MISLEVARNWLRVDGTDNDVIIQSLLNATPDYIEVATGLTAEEQTGEPLADTVDRFLLSLWYFPDQPNADKIEQTINSLLKTLTVMKEAS